MRYNCAVRLLAAAAVLLFGRAVHADGEQAVSASIGWATFSVPGKAMPKQAPPTLTPDFGGALAVSYERALSTDLSLRGELAGGLFRGGMQAMQSPTSYAALGDAGLVFRFDVLNIVPYAFGGLGAATAGGGPLDRTIDPVLVVGAGVDWLERRERSYGIEARLASFGGDLTIVTVGVRGTLRWGFL
jgi:hypothetical protein